MVRTSSTRMHPRRGGADRDEGIVHRPAPVRPAPPGLRPGGHGTPQQPHDRDVEPAAHPDRERAGLVVAAFGEAPASQGHPRHRVGRRRLGGGHHRVGERRGHVAPAGELQPVHGLTSGSRVPEGRPDERDGRRWTLVTRGDVEQGRAAASRAPRRRERLERVAARPAERPRSVAASGATRAGTAGRAAGPTWRDRSRTPVTRLRQEHLDGGGPRDRHRESLLVRSAG